MSTRSPGTPALAAVLALVSLSPSERALEAQTSYPLTCRGGAQMTVRVSAESEHGWAEVGIFFERAPAGATQSLPAAGQCAWLDRGVAADEPARLHGGFWGVQMVLDIQGDGQLRSYSFGGTDRAKSERLRGLLDTLFAGEPFTVRVRAKGSGDNRYLEIVRIGP